MRKPVSANGYIEFASMLCFALLVCVEEGFAKPIHSANASPPGVVFVVATVEGQPAMLLLDTGSERSSLDSGFAVRLGVHPASVENIVQPYGTRPVESIRIGDLELQSFHVKNMELLSIDLTSMSLALGVPVDGIVGSDVLRLFTVRIDFSSASAQFTANVPVPAGEGFVSLHSVGNLYYVPLSIQGASINLLLDTGTNASSVSSHVWDNVVTNWQPKLTVDGIRSSGGPGSTKFVFVPTIGIGDATLTDVALRVQPQITDGMFADVGFNGLLGADVLSQFVVTLDLARDRMYLKRNPNYHPDLDRFSAIGIQFARNPEGSFTIMAVWSPSPAADANLKIGDRILMVNQQDTLQMSLEDLSRQIHGSSGSEVHLVIDSNGHRQDISVTIRCLLCPTDAAGENTALRVR
jgi:predicted aspartyl protease